MSPQPRGRFVWHELMTSDPKAAAAFYGKVVGWKPQSWEQDPSYTLLTANGTPMAGSMRLPDEARSMGMPPHWLSYIGTPDVDATARQATSLGGRVLKQPESLRGVGRFAVLQDPQNATFAVFTPEYEGGGDGPAPLGGFSWHELITTDHKAALEFYGELFGWVKTQSMDMGDMGVYQMYGLVGSSRVDLQACKLEYSIVSPK